MVFDKKSPVQNKVLLLIRKRIWRYRQRVLSWIFPDRLVQVNLVRALKPEFPTVEAFVKHQITNQEPFFFLKGKTPQTIFSSLEKVNPEVKQKLIQRADLICRHIFDLLGSGSKELGNPIDWHVDFKTGYRWPPLMFYRDIHPAPFPGGYDIKLPWELSRCQHLVWLGQAYWATGDEKYTLEFISQVKDWVEKNPWPFGVNWANAMEVAIRAVNWLWSYHFFRKSPVLTHEFLIIFFKSLLQHGRHIEHNLEWSPTLTTNHYLANLAGLVYLGILLPEFREAQRWVEFGLRELEREMFRQVYPDGVDFETSTSYHRLVVELFFSTTHLACLNGYTFSKDYLARLEKMLEFILHCTRTDGTSPLIGDNDNGRVIRLKTWDTPDQEWNDFRYLLAIGAVLFNRADFARASGNEWEEAIWFFGGEALEYWKNLPNNNLIQPELTSWRFEQAGFFILHNRDIHCLVTAGGNGQNGFGGHAHNDKLSFTFHSDGQDWLIDPGTANYTGDHQLRNLFRSTSYHNTSTLDGCEQNRFDNGDLFRLQADAQVRIHHWITTPECDIFDASHSGYQRLNYPVTHRRQIYLRKTEDPYLVLYDNISGEGEHLLEMNFHLGDIHVELVSPQLTLLAKKVDPSSQLGLFQFGDDLYPVEATKTWVAPGYGMKNPNIALKYRKIRKLPTSFLMVFCWSPFINKLEQKPEIVWHTIQPGLERLTSFLISNSNIF